MWLGAVCWLMRGHDHGEGGSWGITSPWMRCDAMGSQCAINLLRPHPHVWTVKEVPTTATRMVMQLPWPIGPSGIQAIRQAIAAARRPHHFHQSWKLTRWPDWSERQGAGFPCPGRILWRVGPPCRSRRGKACSPRHCRLGSCSSIHPHPPLARVP